MKELSKPEDNLDALAGIPDAEPVLQRRLSFKFSAQLLRKA